MYVATFNVVWNTLIVIKKVYHIRYSATKIDHTKYFCYGNELGKIDLMNLLLLLSFTQ